MDTYRAPRCYLRIGGVKVACESATVKLKSTRSGNTFSAVLAIGETRKAGFDYAEWADYQPDDVTVVMSSALNFGDETDMITGKIDKPEIDWLTGRVSVSGRDKTGELTEKRRSQKFQNQKSDEVVKTIAGDHGLSVSGAGGGLDFAGKIYTQDTVHLTVNKTDFEIISDLAEREGYRWYVQGTTLYFEPKEQDGADTYQIQFTPPGAGGAIGTGNLLSLRTWRNMTAARPHKVNVRSWHHEEKKLYNGKAEAGGVGAPVEHEHHHNGRNDAQAEKLAKSRLANAIRHDCNVSITAPGDLAIDPRQKLQLTGTGTIYDQTYDIDTVELSMDWGKGFTMDIESKAPKQGRS